MPSSLSETLDRELAVRGGVSLGLGPFLRTVYGESDLRGEINGRLLAALEAEDTESIEYCLLLELSVAGCLPKRTLGKLADRGNYASLLARICQARDPERVLLGQFASQDKASEELKLLADTAADDDADPIGSAVQSGLFEEPRKTLRKVERTAKKLGRNDPCPCGSGQKYKKCHEGKVLPKARPDASGSPGMTKAEAFVFRDEAECLGALCHKRLRENGPRSGETLYWPVGLSCSDELQLRAFIARDSPEQLARVVCHGVELGELSGEELGDLVWDCYSVKHWLNGDVEAFFKALGDKACRVIKPLEGMTVSDILARREQKEEDALASFKETCEGGEWSRAAAHLFCQSLSGGTYVHFVISRFLMASPTQFRGAQAARLMMLEESLAETFGHTPLVAVGSGIVEDATMRTLRRERDRLRRRVEDCEREVASERQLRQRAEAVWKNRHHTADDDDTLRTEVKRLRSLLKDEREAARVAMKDVQHFRRRERIRLLRESQLEADVVAALVNEIGQEDGGGGGLDAEDGGREICYHAEFEDMADRVPESTLERLKGQIDQFAQGKWVREAKRMEAIEDVWTLRAGIHYRALIRVRDDVVEVFDLIPREELESALARLRRR